MAQQADSATAGPIGSMGRHTGPRLSRIAFPLGGISTGTVALSGTGRLIDWEIFRRPGKGHNLPCFFALRVARDDSPPVVRMLERERLAPYATGDTISASFLGGIPRFPEAVFHGQYPMAWFTLEDDSFPVDATLEAFNPFLPLDVDNSAIPGAVLTWRLTNRTDHPLDLTLMAGIRNPVGWQTIGVQSESLPERTRTHQSDSGMHGILFDAPNWRDSCDPNTSSVFLGSTAPIQDIQLFGHAPRQHGIEFLWRKFVETGRLEDDREFLASNPKPDHWTEDWPCKFGDYRPDWDHPSLLTVPAVLQPGESRPLTFFLTWHIPYAWAWTDDAIVRTHTARTYMDAFHVARHLNNDLERLASRTRAFHASLFSSTLPPEVLEAASVQAAAFRTASSVLLADGTLYGYEAVGGAYGSCTHVWNPEAVGPFLFPSLERAMRRVEFGASMDPRGAMNSRASMPSVMRWEPGAPFLAADGHMGAVIRAYREWQLSGDGTFLREIWDGVRKAVEFAWNPENDMRWDADKDGLMEGCQSTTYDMPLLGPNPLCTILYLGALEAAARMADHLGEAEIALEFRDVAARGQERLISRLWNGEFFIQKILVAPGLDVPGYLPEVPCFDPEEENRIGRPAEDCFRFQIGRGCMSEQMLGQYLANISGLGDIIDREKILRSLQAIVRYNFREQARDHAHVERAFAVNDESALLLCSWPNGGEPRTKGYSNEAWTGVEYHVAATLMQYGLVDQGLRLVRAVRSRHDGLKRNPWDEIESGNHYARAMSGWALLPALCGLTWSAVEGRLKLHVRVNPESFRSFFSIPACYGEIRQTIRDHAARLEIIPSHGSMRVQEIVWTVPSDTGTAPVTEDPQRVTVSHHSGTSTIRMIPGHAETVEPGNPLVVSVRYA